MARRVQLAPGSLALVLSRPEAPEAAAGEPGGRAVFRAFRRANARCFWNARLARAASRLAFQGWLRRGVLLVRAPHPCLQVLRDAWRRRALRPPRGFRISALGDVFPVQMSPIAQSRFVPLAEVLCCAVSDMNAAQTAATQESLLEHLVKHCPGISIPSQDILYTTLGNLIKERKIYHTGEGYFIVTPQTYFITDTTMHENKRALLSDESHQVPTSVAYLVSVESCAELAEESITASHCPSCRCFPDISTRNTEDPPTTAEVTRKGQKGLEEPTLFTQNQAVSASEDAHTYVSPKSLPYTKDKEKGKKFGFSFLWRSISRKEKAKVEHHNFSAQFPPKEWPVRDEDNLDNIPRDVEHEIIKRINPVLTVDNLTKHTVLMQKYEGQKKYNSQGTSTDVLTARPRRKHPSKEGAKKRQGWSAKPCRRGHSHRDRHRAQSQASEHQPGSIRLEKQPKTPMAQTAPRFKSSNEGEVQQLCVGNPAVLGSHLIYKKRISNPFQDLSLRGNPVSKEYNVQKTRDLKPTYTGPEEKPFQGSRSSDPSRVFDSEAKEQYTEQCHHKLKVESMYVINSPVHPVSDSSVRDSCVNDPPCSIFQSGTCCCSFRESMLRYDVYGEDSKVLPEVLRRSLSHFDRLVETKETQQTLPSQGISSLDPVSSAYRLVDKTIHQFQNLGLLDCPVSMHYLRPHKSHDRDSELIRKAFTPKPETVNLENEGLSDHDHDEQALCQTDMDDDDGACSSLYLEEDDFSENDGLCQVLPGPTQYSFVGGDMWNHLGKTNMTEASLSECNSKTDRFEPQMLSRNHCYKPTGLLSNLGKDSNPNLSAESCHLNPETPYGFNYEGEPNVPKCVQATAPAGGSLHDSASERKINSEAELLQDSVGDPGKRPTSWSQSPPNQEMRKHFTDKMELFGTSHMPVLAQELQHEHSLVEGTENHSMAGDSGIDSPRTQSLASNNSVILDGLKRRQNFPQNFEGTKNSQTFPSNSLLHITPVINV